MRHVIALLLLAFLASCATVEEKDGAFVKAFGEAVGSNNVISNNGGGRVDLFEDAVSEVLKTGRKVRVDGRCTSACARFADKARPNVCITDKAVFRFHKTTGTRTLVRTVNPVAVSGMFSFSPRPTSYEVRYDPSLSPDIRTWVEKRGGFPSEGFLVMNAGEAANFWPLCK